MNSLEVKNFINDICGRDISNYKYIDIDTADDVYHGLCCLSILDNDEKIIYAQKLFDLLDSLYDEYCLPSRCDYVAFRIYETITNLRNILFKLIISEDSSELEKYNISWESFSEEILFDEEEADLFIEEKRLINMNNFEEICDEYDELDMKLVNEDIVNEILKFIEIKDSYKLTNSDYIYFNKLLIMYIYIILCNDDNNLYCNFNFDMEDIYSQDSNFRNKLLLGRYEINEKINIFILNNYKEIIDYNLYNNLKMDKKMDKYRMLFIFYILYLLDSFNKEKYKEYLFELVKEEISYDDSKFFINDNNIPLLIKIKLYNSYLKYLNYIPHNYLTLLNKIQRTITFDFDNKQMYFSSINEILDSIFFVDIDTSSICSPGYDYFLDSIKYGIEMIYTAINDFDSKQAEDIHFLNVYMQIIQLFKENINKLGSSYIKSIYHKLILINKEFVSKSLTHNSTTFRKMISMIGSIYCELLKRGFSTPIEYFTSEIIMNFKNANNITIFDSEYTTFYDEESVYKNIFNKNLINIFENYINFLPPNAESNNTNLFNTLIFLDNILAYVFNRNYFELGSKNTLFILDFLYEEIVKELFNDNLICNLLDSMNKSHNINFKSFIIREYYNKCKFKNISFEGYLNSIINLYIKTIPNCTKDILLNNPLRKECKS